MRARHLPVVLLGLGLSTTQAAAAPIETAGATQCEVSGFSIDPDLRHRGVARTMDTALALLTLASSALHASAQIRDGGIDPLGVGMSTRHSCHEKRGGDGIA
jgi:hypothetical protein